MIHFLEVVVCICSTPQYRWISLEGQRVLDLGLEMRRPLSKSLNAPNSHENLLAGENAAIRGVLYESSVSSEEPYRRRNHSTVPI